MVMKIYSPFERKWFDTEIIGNNFFRQGNGSYYKGDLIEAKIVAFNPFTNDGKNITAELVSPHHLKDYCGLLASSKREGRVSN